ncbi:unnamed protein product, partial [Didymodactylos carnosus]
MSDNTHSTTHPFFIRSGFSPFVILPTDFTFSQTFTGQDEKADKNQTYVNDNKNNNLKDKHDQTEIFDDSGNNDNNTDTITNDANIDIGISNDDEIESLIENNDLRINQPKYEQLLKDLDFSKSRMVDVTDMLNGETQPNTSYYTPNEEETQQSSTSDSTSSSTPPAPQAAHDNEQKSNFSSPNLIDDIIEDVQDHDDDENHVHDDNFQNDLDRLAAIIQEASQNELENHEQPHQDYNVYSSKEFTTTDYDKEPEKHEKKQILDEDDDTSKQATSNYDLIDNEHLHTQQDVPSKSSKIPRSTRLSNQSEYISLRKEPIPRYTNREKHTLRTPPHSSLMSDGTTKSLNNDIQPNNQQSFSINNTIFSPHNQQNPPHVSSLTLTPSTSSSKINPSNNLNENVKNVIDNQEHTINWDNLINGSVDESIKPVVLVFPDTFPQPTRRQSGETKPQSNNSSSPKKHQQYKKKPNTNYQHFFSSDEEQPYYIPRRPVKKSNSTEKVPPRLSPSSSTSSSDTESIATENLDQQQQQQQQQKTNRPVRTETNVKRQDSQATLIDENLDELSSQIKTNKLNDEQGNVHHETKNSLKQTSIKNEKTNDEKDKQSIFGPSDRVYTTASDILLRRLSNQNVEKQQNHNETSNRHYSSSDRHTTIPNRLSNNINKDTPTSTITTKTSNSSKLTNDNNHYSSSSKSNDQQPTSRKMEDTWLIMLEKLEREHKERLERQQAEYEEYMRSLEENMKKRFDNYVINSTVNSSNFDDNRSSNSSTLRQMRHLSPYKLNTNNSSFSSYHNRLNMAIDRALKHRHFKQPSSTGENLSNDLLSHYYPADSTLNVIASTSSFSNPADTHNRTGLSRSQSKEDLINVKAEIHAKHSKHVADLKTYYEHEIDELRHELEKYRLQLTKMGLKPSNINGLINTPVTTSKTTQQAYETIDRINKENIHLRHEINECKETMKQIEDQHESRLTLLGRQIQELHQNISEKDRTLENYHRTISQLEQQLTQVENIKERQDEKNRSNDRSLFLYQEENEKLKTDLNLTKERLMRMEEKYCEQEDENEKMTRQIFLMDGDLKRLEQDNIRLKNRANLSDIFTSMTDDGKLNQATRGIPSSRDYGRFTTIKNSSSASTTPRLNDNVTSGRYSANNFLHPNNGDDLFRSRNHTTSPRPITKNNDYSNNNPSPPVNDKPSHHDHIPKNHSPPSKAYSSTNSSRRQKSIEKNDVENQVKHGEYMENQFDQLMRKKRELESRLNRVPTRGLTTNDRQLLDYLEKELSTVEQQISSVKLELRKMHILK